MVRRVLFFLLLLASSLQAGGRMVIVVGAEGDAEYAPVFAQWADRFAAAAKSGGVRVEQIGPDATAQKPTSQSTTTGPSNAPVSDKESLRVALATMAASSTDPLWLVMIGHGTSDGAETKFNLRGPDVTNKELAEWLKPITGPVAVLDCSSASGPFLNRLSAKNRVIITATRTGSEYQFSRFGEYLSAAIADPAADLDKDGQTSLLEAFLAASHRVDEFYKQNGRIATEHALLDDNGDALGVSADWFQGIRPTRSAKTGAVVDGAAAHRWVLVPTATERALSPERRARRDALEASIEALKKEKATLPEVEYYARLETLMVELAKMYE